MADGVAAADELVVAMWRAMYDVAPAIATSYERTFVKARELSVGTHLDLGTLHSLNLITGDRESKVRRAVVVDSPAICVDPDDCTVAIVACIDADNVGHMFDLWLDADQLVELAKVSA